MGIIESPKRAGPSAGNQMSFPEFERKELYALSEQGVRFTVKPQELSYLSSQPVGQSQPHSPVYLPRNWSRAEVGSAGVVQRVGQNEQGEVLEFVPHKNFQGRFVVSLTHNGLPGVTKIFDTEILRSPQADFDPRLKLPPPIDPQSWFGGQNQLNPD